MLRNGELAPDFELETSNDLKIRLAGLFAAGPVLLFFYFADFTST